MTVLSQGLRTQDGDSLYLKRTVKILLSHSVPPALRVPSADQDSEREEIRTFHATIHGNVTDIDYSFPMFSDV